MSAAVLCLFSAEKSTQAGIDHNGRYLIDNDQTSKVTNFGDSTITLKYFDGGLDLSIQQSQVRAKSCQVGNA